MSVTPSFIERWAVSLGLIPETPSYKDSSVSPNLISHPRPETWDDVVEIDPPNCPRHGEEHPCRLAPTTCFNRKSACGRLASVDKDRCEIRKCEGIPLRPASRGRL